jgi:hypothetical protein
MVTHPSEQLWAEVVQIAAALHWSLGDIVDLEHPTRRRLLATLATTDVSR